MANGQITNESFSLTVRGGTTIKFVGHDGTITEGVISKSPTGEWEILSANPDLLMRLAQGRFVGSRFSTGSIKTRKFNPKDVSILELTIRENNPILGN